MGSLEILSILALVLSAIALLAVVFIFVEIGQIKSKLAQLNKAQPIAPPSRPELPPVIIPPPSAERQIESSGFYSLEEKVVAKCQSFFSSVGRLCFAGNPIAKLGILVFIIGISFFVHYAANQGYFSIQLRLILAVVAGLILLTIGWITRKKNHLYATLMLGGGIGVLYIAIYVGYSVYELIPSIMAFGFLVLFSITGGALAVIMDAKRLAVMALLAGFLAPILSSSGSGNYIGLLSYFFALNLGVAFIAWFKAWRGLNRLSFIFTVLLAGLWGYNQYTPDKYLAAQGFLIAFSLLYSIILLFFAKHAHSNWMDTTFAVGLPIISFSFQALIVEPYVNGLAFSALGFALYYAGLAHFLQRQKQFFPPLLLEVIVAFAIIFVTLVFPFALSGSWIGLAWALEGVIVIWLGSRRQYVLAKLFGTFLLLGSGYYLLQDKQVLQLMLMAIASYFGAYCLHKKPTTSARIDCLLSNTLFFFAIFWNILFVYHAGREFFQVIGAPSYARYLEITQAKVSIYEFKSLIHGLGSMLAVILSFVCTWMAFERTEWRKLFWLEMSSVAVFFIFIMYFMQYNFLLLPIFMLLVLGFALQNSWLKRAENYPLRYFKLVHIPFAVTVILFFTWSLKVLLVSYVFNIPGLSNFAYGVLPAMALLLLCTNSLERLWMVKRYPKQYFGSVGFLLVLYLMFWLLFQNLYISKHAVLSVYLPILNLRDMASLIAIFAVTLWLVNKRNQRVINWEKSSLHILAAFFGFVVFLWVNAVLLRALAIYLDLNPFHLFSVQVVQMSLSILWATIALILVIVANRIHSRAVWIAGAVLIGLLILKLVAVDFIESDTVERIVAFLGAGVLLLIAGYVAPIPVATVSGDKHVK